MPVRGSTTASHRGSAVNHNRFRYLSSIPPSGVPDEDLLSRWVAHGDEAAFELLVRRHAPMVLAACRRLLRDSVDADDAFQAAFLVLARKAGSVARGAALGAWLHQVAVRAALRIRADRLKRTDRHGPNMVDYLPAPSPSEPACSELLQALDEEVERLPPRHRAAFVLCCLEGKTGEEAGRLLGCPAGTVSSRLTRARERLRDRLTRRGFAPAALLVVGAVSDADAVTVPNALIESVLRAAPAFSAARPNGGPATRPSTIAEGVVRAMFINKLRLVSALLAAGLLVVGAAFGVGRARDRDGAEPPQPVPKVTATVTAPTDDPPRAPVVRLTKPQPGGLDRVITMSCAVEPSHKVNLVSDVTGVLKRVTADIGDRVKAGHVLAEIDAPALVLDERRAAVVVEQAEGLLKEAQAAVATAKAEADAAKATVQVREAGANVAKTAVTFRKKQLDRVKALANANAVDGSAVNEREEQLMVAEGQEVAAVLNVANAKADLLVKESKLHQATAAVRTAELNIKVAQIGLERARLATAQTRITAPFDGVVARNGGSVGQLVRPGDRPEEPLFTVVRTDIVRIVFGVHQQDLGVIELGREVEVELPGTTGGRVAGKVTRVGATLDRVSATVRVEIDLPNPKGDIRLGMFGTVYVKHGKGPDNAVRVPASAVFEVASANPNDPTTSVYAYKDGKARKTPVRVSYRNGNEAEVASGLTADDVVVTNPRALMPQAEVAVEVEKPAPPK